MHLPLPRILLTNDDGFDAPGLLLLAEIVKPLANEIWIVAPENDQSATSQAVTITKPLRLREHAARLFSVSGTASDCVVMAMMHVMKDCPPSLILSGINPGANVGDDICFSGTIGAAFTGLVMGVPSMAISLSCFTHREMPLWETPKALLPELLENFIREGWDHNHCLSLNFPDAEPDEIKGLCWTHLARRTLPTFTVDQRVDIRHNDYFWIHPKRDESAVDSGSDIAALRRKQISVTALEIDRSAAIIAAPLGKKTANDE